MNLRKIQEVEHVGYRFRFPGMPWYFTKRVDDFGPGHTAEIEKVYVIR